MGIKISKISLQQNSIFIKFWKSAKFVLKNLQTFFLILFYNVYKEKMFTREDGREAPLKPSIHIALQTKFWLSNVDSFASCLYVWTPILFSFSKFIEYKYFPSNLQKSCWASLCKQAYTLPFSGYLNTFLEINT